MSGTDTRNTHENDRCVERFLGQTQRLWTRLEREPGGRL